MEEKEIFIKGARVHNLKNISVRIPRNALVVITGVSGSGKSSLAFDTLYAEGQRRYVESLSSYARQFIGVMQKPDVDYIDGLSPAIAIDQKSASKNPRSTVGTMSEIYDYMRLLFARIGIPYCPEHGIPIKKQSPQEIFEKIFSIHKDKTINILASLVEGKKGEYRKLLEDTLKKGFETVKINGEFYLLEDPPTLDKNKKHTIELLVDKVVVEDDEKSRIFDSIEVALREGDGILKVQEEGKKEIEVYSSKFACPLCGFSLQEIEPRLFSFNSPYGACPECTGLGFKIEPDIELILDKNLSLNEGAIKVPGFLDVDSYSIHFTKQVLEFYGFDSATPIKKLPGNAIDLILYGANERVPYTYADRYGEKHTFRFRFEGLVNLLKRRYGETQSPSAREEYEKFMKLTPCPVCSGKRLKKEALSVKILDNSISDITEFSIEKAYKFFKFLPEKLTEQEKAISKQVLREIQERLKFILDVGLGYLSLDRRSATLAGGEAQRLRLATQVGSKLVGVLYVLDEPSIGLHSRDNIRLLNTLRELKDLGNTLVIVEHDEETIRTADFIVDMGPLAGEKGGKVVVAGTLDDVLKCEKSLTGKYLRGELKIELPLKRRKGNGKKLIVRGLKEHNLKNIDVEFPLNTFITITGVSGSGKSTLINDCLYKALAQRLYKSKEEPGKFSVLEGIEHIDKVVIVDQSPIGRTPRSNPATYTGVFTPIRELFSSLPDAKIRGYKPGRFSFNVRGGRCENCEGNGFIKVEMQFLPDVYVPCEVCHGKRFNSETQEVKYKDKNIADILDMSVDEAHEFFLNIPRIKNIMSLLKEVGLGYIKLGQSALTLSGGEAQRVKLASELQKRPTGHTLYLLDEPTTGLHFADIHLLLNVLQKLIDKGNTVVVIEHNLEVIKSSDYIIDLGPEGGDKGGYLVASGTPEEVATNKKSYTGEFLKEKLY